MSDRLHAIVVAAGSGERFRADADAGAMLPKQFQPLCGQPVIAWSLAVIARLRPVSLVVVVAMEHAPRVQALAVPGLRTVAGGATRADSVRAGLDALTASADDWVMVHDAARPCVTVGACRRLLDAVADSAVGGLLAVRVTDTAKRTHAAGELRVAETLARGTVWLAQTPQVFRYGLLRRGLALAASADAAITDEAAAVEQLGESPLLVDGDFDNLKITEAADLARAARVLATRTA